MLAMLAMLAQVVSCCAYDKTKVNIPYMDGNIPHLFFFWADPFVHLLLLKSSMPQLMKMFSFSYSFAKRKSVFVNVATTTATKRQKVHHPLLTVGACCSCCCCCKERIIDTSKSSTQFSYSGPVALWPMS